MIDSFSHTTDSANKSINIKFSVYFTPPPINLEKNNDFHHQFHSFCTLAYVVSRTIFPVYVTHCVKWAKDKSLQNYISSHHDQNIKNLFLL